MLIRWRYDIISPSTEPACDVNITLYNFYETFHTMQAARILSHGEHWNSTAIHLFVIKLNHL